MRTAAQVSSPRRIAARDLITREASMLSSPDNSDLDGGQGREYGGFAGNWEKISPGVACADLADLQRHPADGPKASRQLQRRHHPVRRRAGARRRDLLHR